MAKANTNGGREQTHDFHMRVSSAVLAVLDKKRRKQKDMPSRAEMIRRLIMENEK